jgi:tetratricopeptide (TPR) repeat protein
VGLALHGLGELACLRGQPDHAYDYIERAIKIFKELDDPKQEAWSLNLMGQIELSQGKLTAAQGYFEQSLGAFRAVGSLGGVSAALVNLGQSLYYRGLGDQAAPLFEECVGINQALNRPRHSGNLMALNYLAEIAAVRGQIRQAHELNDTSLKLSKEAGYTWCIERANFTAGMLSIQNGEMDSAAFSFQESLLMQQSHKEIWRALILLESVASHSAIRHHALSAARLFGAAEAQRRTTKVRRMPVYQHEYELSLATLKGQMESDALADAWSSGQELSLDQALAYAWRCLDD